ncbi:hypothetical protein BC827DRAFT_967735 [Russula dissimulans]|nr:hypothetical protein BC827DRAFT_967735 [Russula dissimulans]
MFNDFMNCRADVSLKVESAHSGSFRVQNNSWMASQFIRGALSCHASHRTISTAEMACPLSLQLGNWLPPVESRALNLDRLYMMSSCGGCEVVLLPSINSRQEINFGKPTEIARAWHRIGQRYATGPATHDHALVLLVLPEAGSWSYDRLFSPCVQGRGPFLFSNHHFFGTYRAEPLVDEFTDPIECVYVRSRSIPIRKALTTSGREHLPPISPCPGCSPHLACLPISSSCWPGFPDIGETDIRWL